MGFLDKIWDETVAGPTPDSGLGKLRKYNSVSAGWPATGPPSGVAPPRHDENHVTPISRSITVLRGGTHRNLSISVDSPSNPSSPVGSSGPSSPFSPNSPGRNFKKLDRRKTTSGALRREDVWIMLTTMDR